MLLVLSKYIVCVLYARKATTEQAKTVFNFPEPSAINIVVIRFRMILTSYDAMGLV